MAMSKSVATKLGVAATYHKINIQRIDWMNKVAMVEVGSWIDAAARQNNPDNPLMKTEVYWTGDNFPFAVASNNIQLAYESLAKARLNAETGIDENIFTGATEV